MKTFCPAVDIQEGGSEVVLWIDIPGVREEDLQLTVVKDELALAAKVQVIDRSKMGRGYQEYEEGNYQRVFSLSNEIDRDNIKADYKDGVLKVTLLKTEQAKPRKIEIKTA